MGASIVESRHREIVAESQDPVARVVALVGYIQRVPFRFDPSLSDPESGPLTVLEGRTGGSCTPKHYALALLLQQEARWRATCGLPELRLAYLTYPFRFRQVLQFDNSRVKFPPNIQICRLPEGHHAALEVRLGEVGRALLVDVTWDPPLARMGFPVFHPWDAKSDMTLAVPYGGEKFTADSLEKKLRQLKYLATRDERFAGECDSPESLLHILDAANEWFDNIRRGAG